MLKAYRPRPGRVLIDLRSLEKVIRARRHLHARTQDDARENDFGTFAEKPTEPALPS